MDLRLRVYASQTRCVTRAQAAALLLLQGVKRIMRGERLRAASACYTARLTPEHVSRVAVDLPEENLEFTGRGKRPILVPLEVTMLAIEPPQAPSPHVLELRDRQLIPLVRRLEVRPLLEQHDVVARDPIVQPHLVSNAERHLRIAVRAQTFRYASLFDFGKRHGSQTNYAFVVLLDDRRGSCSSRSTRTRRYRFVSGLQGGHSLFARHARERLEKLLEAVIPLEVIDEVSEGNARTDKHGRAPEKSPDRCAQLPTWWACRSPSADSSPMLALEAQRTGVQPCRAASAILGAQAIPR